MINDLYNTAILTLAAGIPHIGKLDNPAGSATKTAKLCGSRVTVELCLDDNDCVCQFAQQVKACALGQAAAAILGANVMGASIEELEQARDGLWAMLQTGVVMPAGRFAALEKLAGVAAFSQRHSSTCLAFDAVVEAAHEARS
ncbi:Putative iron-sulfur cluster assembly scaffold protein for SUF system, SufE2 [hydrothermal vent metagenome]|uniref:Iron-sulfur cluster assembly scaffold protein for SUF system, SufE2 n=1 Tax=hydrothermal vent metagenome TaxID=652676 RepID=A0A3B0R496_9ZZZZ